MDLNAFLMANVETELTDEVVISRRFKDEDGELAKFKIRAITAKRNNELNKESEIKEVKNGVVNTITNYDIYMAKLVTECTIHPNFKSKELQDSWGVLGADQLINKMLLPGELAELGKQIQRLNGFESIEALKAEVKKPLTEAMQQ